MRKLRLVCGMLLAAGTLLAEARADVRLPKFFTDNMMLQRDKPIRVWGWAAPGEGVQVALAGKNVAAEKAAAKADGKGRWSVELPALKEGENLELTVTGKNMITLKNVILGDIWLCSGQSNMSMPLMACPWDPPEHINFGAPEDSKKADFPKIRHLSINGRLSRDPVEDSSTLPNISNWQVCSPQLTGSHVFTAAGFYFAREVFGKTGVPIGIIDDAWSSSAIEPWIPQEGVEAVPELKEAWDKRQKAIADYRLAKGRPPTIPPTIIPDLEGINKENWCSIYNAMINPLIRIPIKGVLWYQGESNFQPLQQNSWVNFGSGSSPSV